MTQTLEATFDGKVLRPDIPLKLRPNTRVRVTVETIKTAKKKRSFLRTAKSLKLEGPRDWSTHIEDYLYAEKK